MLNTPDFFRLLHPIIAVSVVFPLIGIVLYMATQTRQRRLQTKDKKKSKIPPIVGAEHVKLGRWLTTAVVCLSLLGLAHPSIKFLLKGEQEAFQGVAIALFFIATIASLVFLHRARPVLWRAIFASLTAIGVLVIGLQDIVFAREGFGAIFRRDDQWYISHFYFGMVVTLLMIFSLATLPEIYRSLLWRRIHIALNVVALLLFISQGVTGTRDLLEIPLSWQEPFIYQCDFENQTCGDVSDNPSGSEALRSQASKPTLLSEF